MKKPCLNCGIPTQSSRCPSCAEIELSKKPQRYRASSSERGYGSAWQRMRVLVLDRDGWTCYLCGKKLIGSDATVDHIIPLFKDRSLALDPKNLAACCRSCNSKKINK